MQRKCYATELAVMVTRYRCLDKVNYSFPSDCFDVDVTNSGNGERGTGNGEWRTGNGERGTGNGERGTGNGERGTGNGSLGTSVQR